MRALVFQRPHEAVVVEDREAPAIGPDEVLVRLERLGVCHSDFELLEGRYIIPVTYPIVPGHEWAGEVVEAGPAVRGLAVGDRVVGESVIGEDHFGFSISGAGAEYFKARPEWLHRLPDELSWEQGALVEPFSVAYQATRSAGGVDASDTVLVLGGGPIGLLCVAAAAAQGATVDLVEPQAFRREAGAKLGARRSLDPAGGALASWSEEGTGGRGYDVVIEASGARPALAAAYELAAQNGRVVHVGINVTDRPEVELGLIQRKGLRVSGVIGAPGIWPETIRFLASSGLDLSPVVTAVVPLERALEALDAALDGARQVKVQIAAGAA
jgi:L-iditol 2-dehydrogenase